MKRKITEIPIRTITTVYNKNEKGERVPVPKEITMFKQVQTVTGWRRFGHYLLDSFCYFVFLLFLIIIAAALRGVVNLGIFDQNGELNELTLRLGSWLFLSPMFYSFWEYFFQKTPGKWITRCRVVNEYGEKPTFLQILGRSYARSIPFEAFSCFGDRGWHDSLSNTYVIDEEHLKELKAVMMIDEIGKPFEQNAPENLRPNDSTGVS